MEERIPARLSKRRKRRRTILVLLGGGILTLGAFIACMIWLFPATRPVIAIVAVLLLFLVLVMSGKYKDL